MPSEVNARPKDYNTLESSYDFWSFMNHPKHIAIIMDGNGRWAQQRGLSRVQGHRKGKESVREITEAAREQLGWSPAVDLATALQESLRAQS